MRPITFGYNEEAMNLNHLRVFASVAEHGSLTRAARDLRVSQPAVTEHLKILSRAGFLQSKRIKKWTFYKRKEQAIKAIKRAISQRV